jgi:hypothetical protein
MTTITTLEFSRLPQQRLIEVGGTFCASMSAAHASPTRASHLPSGNNMDF